MTQPPPDTTSQSISIPKPKQKPGSDLTVQKRLRFFRNHLLLLILFAFVPCSLIAKPTVLVLGDSIAAGYGLEKLNAFPALLQDQLITLGYADAKVINGGFSGSTSASALKRLHWYLQIKPDILVLELGANDGLRGHDVLTIKKNLSKTIQMALTKDMKVLLAGMKMPPNYGIPYTRQFESLYYELAKEHTIPLIPFLLEGVAGNPKLNLADGIHPNAQGHRIITRTVLKHILELLKH